METTVKQRINEFCKYKKISKSAFARAIGVSATYVGSIRKSIQPDKINSIACNYPELNIAWLLTGEGEMLKGDGGKEAGKGQPERQDATIIRLLPLSAQGGSLNDFTVSVKDDDCEKIISPIRGVDFAITVSGNSMAPEYPNGCRIFIKKINERAFIEWGKVYVLDTCNGTLIKKIMPGKDEGCLTCESLNPEYPPFFVSFGDIYGMYKVLLMMAEK